MNKNNMGFIKLCIFTVFGIAAIGLVIFLFNSLPSNIYADEHENTNSPDSNSPNNSNNISNITDSPTYGFPDYTFEPLIEAYKVIIDGSVVGIIPDAFDLERMILSLQKQYEIRENLHDTVYELTKDISIEKMQTYQHNITDTSVLMEALAQCIDYKIHAYELSNNGYTIGFYFTEKECNGIIDDAKKNFLAMNFSDKTVLDLSYDKDFTITPVIIHKEDLEICSYDAAVSLISNCEYVNKEINVSSADELKAVFDEKIISDSCNYSDALDSIASNGYATITYIETIVNFNATIQKIELASIPFSTQIRPNTSMSYNATKTVRSGVEGTKTFTYSDTYYNGQFISSKLISEKITAQPIGAIIECGTKIPLRTTVTALTGLGQFVWPTTGFITSKFSNVSGSSHYGIDIGNVYGTPIYAAASGKVTLIQVLPDSYGKYVKIAHDNGYETLYAHMSWYAVTTGQYVKQGQIIGYVGATGIATGPHCHFTVIKNGTPIDPTTVLYGYAS